MRISALSLLLLTACSDQPASPNDPEPNTWYQLATVDGAELPLLEPDGSTLYGGILEFEGPYYELSVSWHTSSGVGVDSTFAGTYEIDGSILVLRDFRDEEDIALSIPTEGIVRGEIWPGRLVEFWESWN